MNDHEHLPGDPPCIDVVEIVTAYLDGALGREDATRLEAHLADCEDCAEYVEQVRSTIRVARGTVHEDAMPADLRERVRAAFRDRRSP